MVGPIPAAVAAGPWFPGASSGPEADIIGRDITDRETRERVTQV